LRQKLLHFALMLHFSSVVIFFGRNRASRTSLFSARFFKSLSLNSWPPLFPIPILQFMNSNVTLAAPKMRCSSLSSTSNDIEGCCCVKASGVLVKAFGKALRERTHWVSGLPKNTCTQMNFLNLADLCRWQIKTIWWIFVSPVEFLSNPWWTARSHQGCYRGVLRIKLYRKNFENKTAYNDSFSSKVLE